jgi:nucleotidyltransferase/DNA polymerase involved in DNA repair
VLAPAADLRRLMVGAGVERCRDLAGLDAGAVEVRFGAEGIALWRLARADDRRRLFEPMPASLPEASLEWTDYTLRDPEQLQFVVNRLAGSVTDALHERGQGAREVTLVFHLANGQTVERPFRLARVNADARTWMRLLRNGLEELRLPDAVTGVRLRVDAAAPSESSQGDLFDRGFATAQAAEAALARVVDEGSALVTPETSRHALPRRRTRWIERPPALVWARPQIAPEDTTPSLALHLHERPERVEVETHDRRGHRAPLRYRARDGRHELVTASGPDCVSGGQWEDEAHAFELYCCVRMDGEIVLLARDARSDEWEVAGEWR